MNFSNILDSLLAGAAQPREFAGKVGDIAGDLFGQASGGLKDAAGKVNDLTGASDKLDAAAEKVSGGQDVGDLFGKAKGIVTENKVVSGAVLGGLGLLLMGSKSGRKLAAGAAGAGGLALIGGLAFKAWQNKQDGKPLLDRDHIDEAPEGSGFEVAALDNVHAELYVRAMIAAAAADNEVSEEERYKITLGMKDAGVQEQVTRFLEQEFEKPATISELVAGANNPQVGAQVYTAARLAIEPDTPAEISFLERLAAGLQLAPELVANVDASAKGLRV